MLKNQKNFYKDAHLKTVFFFYLFRLLKVQIQGTVA